MKNLSQQPSVLGSKNYTNFKQYNFTNSKKNVILKTKSKNIWIFKSDIELVIEDSIYVDNNKTIPTKQIVIKGVINNIKQTRKWSFEKQ